ncbi:hypothetical protein H0H87_008924 [Tephrocybe sp. NHM501043]|nr:hypothetical protein H0H87_008924 [Tephrocybe sp. NHM501043]
MKVFGMRDDEDFEYSVIKRLVWAREKGDLVKTIIGILVTPDALDVRGETLNMLSFVKLH